MLVEFNLMAVVVKASNLEKEGESKLWYHYARPTSKVMAFKHFYQNTYLLNDVLIQFGASVMATDELR